MFVLHAQLDLLLSTLAEVYNKEIRSLRNCLPTTLFSNQRGVENRGARHEVFNCRQAKRSRTVRKDVMDSYAMIVFLIHQSMQDGIAG